MKNAVAAAAPAPRPAAWVLALLVLLTLLLGAVQARAVEVQRVVSPGGIEAWLVEAHTTPIIALELAFRGRSALDPAGNAALAHIAAPTIAHAPAPLPPPTPQAPPP